MPGLAGWARCPEAECDPCDSGRMLATQSRSWYRTATHTDAFCSFGVSEPNETGSNDSIYTNKAGTITACLYGNVYAPVQEDGRAAKGIARAYEEQGSTFLASLNGEFFVLILDRRRNRLIIATDRYGRRPVYFRHEKGLLLFASSIKALIAAGTFKPVVDYSAAADLLSLAFIPGQRTLLETVSLLPPAGLLEMNLETGNCTVQTYWSLADHLNPHTGSDSKLLSELGIRFAEAVERRLSGKHTNWLSLSAGMDSRSIAACLHPDAYEIKAVTSGVEGSHEKYVTSLIAQATGIDHFFYTFDVAQLTQSENGFSDLFSESIRLTDGMRGTASSAMTAFSSRLRREHGLQWVITGHGGEIAKLDEAYSLSINSEQDIKEISTDTADWAYQRFTRPNAPRDNNPSLYLGPLSEQIYEAPRAHLRESLEHLDSSLPPAQIVSYLFLNELFRKRAAYALSVQRAYVNLHTPFYDDDFLDLAVNTPLSVRSRYKVHRQIIQANHPALLDIILSETRMRPFPGPLEKLLRGKPYALARRLGLYKRDVPEHYFAANADSGFFSNVLLSERTMDRGTYNPDRISSLLKLQAQGQRSANTLLHLLTIFELWNRDYID